jgi:hypothetical protein
VRAVEFENERVGETDPRDYRRGKLFGSIPVVAGALLGIVLVVLTLEDLQERNPFDVVLLIFMFVLSGILILSGQLLIGRGKLGLWGMYLLSVLFIYSFCVGTVSRLVSHTPNDVYRTMMGGIILSLWLLLAGYFHNRRKLFTDWWGSKNEA